VHTGVEKSSRGQFWMHRLVIGTAARQHLRTRTHLMFVLKVLRFGRY